MTGEVNKDVTVDITLLAEQIATSTVVGIMAALASAGVVVAQGTGGAVGAAGGVSGQAGRVDTSTMSKTDVETAEKYTVQGAEWLSRDRQWYDSRVAALQEHEADLRSHLKGLMQSATRSVDNSVAQQGLFETLATLLKIFNIDKLNNVNETDYTAANILRDQGSTGVQSNASIVTMLVNLAKILTEAEASKK